MAKADILLRENRVGVVGKGTKKEEGLERGAFEISVGKDDTPSIRMSADQANVNIGGGTGTSTEGDLRLNDADGDTRIQLTAADDGNRPAGGTDRVWINGGDGTLGLGPRATSGNHSVQLTADSEENDRRFELQLGEYKGVDIFTTNPEAGYGSGSGAAQFWDEHGTVGVEIQGNAALLSLGYAYLDTAEFQGQEVTVFKGKNGRIQLDDGFSGSPAASSVFEIRARRGKLEILDDVDGETLFVIDSNPKSGRGTTRTSGSGDVKGRVTIPKGVEFENVQ